MAQPSASASTPAPATIDDIEEFDLINMPYPANSSDADKFGNYFWKGIVQARNAATNVRTDINAASSNITLILGRLAAIESWKAAAEGEIQSLKGQLSTAKTELADARVRIGQLETRAIGADSIAQGLDTRLSTVETTVKNASTGGSTTGLVITPPKARDPKMPEPSKYDGRRGQPFENWFNSVAVMFSGMPITYGPDSSPDHRKRVLFIIGTLKDGALSRAQPYIDSLRNGPAHSHLDNYPEFVKALEKTFGDPLKKLHALEKMNTIRKGNRTAPEFLAEFRNLVTTAGVTEFISIEEKLRTATNFDVLARMDDWTPATDLEKLYEQIEKADARNRELARRKKTHDLFQNLVPNKPPQGQKGSPSPSSQSNRNTSNKPPVPPSSASQTASPSPSTPKPPRNPDAMEIDTNGEWHITPAEKQRRSAEGLCWRCGKPGHMANKCTLGARKSTVAATTVEPAEQGNEDA